MSTRRSFLAWGAAGSAGLALAACSNDDTSGGDQPSPSNSAPADAATPAVAGGSLKKVVLADQPVLYLPFQDEADATVPADASGHDRTVELVGERWWPNDALDEPAPDGVGRAWYSGDSEDKCTVRLPGAKQWLADAPTTGVTVEAWLRQDDANYNQTLLQLVSDADETGWAFGLKPEGDGYNLEGPEYKNVQLPTPRIAKAWHHLAVTCDPKGHVVGYFDGKPVGEGELGPFKGAVKDVLVGTKSTPGAPLTGCWSQFAVFASALSAERVAAHHAAATAPTEPPVRGVDTWFGGPGYYRQFDRAEVLADPKRFPVAEWWWNAFEEECPVEKQYADGAVVVDPNNDPAWIRKAGVWAIRLPAVEKDVEPGAETIGWMPQDEPDMDAEKMVEFDRQAKKIPDGYLSYANYGTGVTISTIDRYRVRPLVDRPDVHQVSADLYSYCTKPKMSQQTAEAWGIDAGLVRRAAVYGQVVDRARAFLSRPLPVWGVVATGHANNVAADDEGWASVPSADEVEGAIMSCITHGASGILLFPQSFPDSKKAPVWQPGTQYQAGDTVRDPKEEHLFFYARTEPKKGVNPNEVTDDSWLRWRPHANGLRNTEHYARGVSERVAAVKKRLQRLAPVLNSRSVPARAADELHVRHWPDAPDGYHYLLAMQQLEHDKGTWTLTLPAGQTPSSVEVVDEDRTITVSDGTFRDEFAAEYVHHLYRWK